MHSCHVSNLEGNSQGMLFLPYRACASLIGAQWVLHHRRNMAGSVTIPLTQSNVSNLGPVMISFSPISPQVGTMDKMLVALLKQADIEDGSYGTAN